MSPALARGPASWMCSELSPGAKGLIGPASELSDFPGPDAGVGYDSYFVSGATPLVSGAPSSSGA